MAQWITDSYILSKEEYEKLTNPDATYTLVTKTAAKKIVTSLLKHYRAECWLDGDQDKVWYCSQCPVFAILGDEGGRLCLRQKNWSK